MCGIVGYIGRQDAAPVVLEGLTRLEHRGYDSAGVAVVADGTVGFRKKAGKLLNLEQELRDNPELKREDGDGKDDGREDGTEL